MPDTISVVIPAHNSSQFLTRCLDSLAHSTLRPFEIIVVDDASTDGSGSIAGRAGAVVVQTHRKSGPAHARNLGAGAARGTILLFLDSDVCVAPTTLERILASFSRDPALDGLIVSYDSHPDSPDFLSQYRNLMHAYVHGKGSQRASTFWSGCGAIRTNVFLEHSGFDEKYGRPAIEDIELGYRLRQADRQINLDPSIQVTHLKRWTFWSLLKTDILDRGIPWTELILRNRHMPNDLNLELSQRVSVALVVLSVGLAAVLVIQSGVYLLIPPVLVILLMLSAWWSEVLADKTRPAAYPLLVAAFAAGIGVAFYYRLYAMIFPLAIGLPILRLRHRYSSHKRVRRWTRPAGIAYLCLTAAAALRYIWGPHPLVFLCTMILIITALLNSEFYVFLAGKRGLVFTLAAIPFHFLYHFYNGFSFIAGTFLHVFGAHSSPLSKSGSSATLKGPARPAAAPVETRSR